MWPPFVVTSYAPGAKKSFLTPAIACLPSLKPILNLLIYGTFSHSSQSSGAPVDKTLVTIGGTSVKLGTVQGSDLRLNPRSHGTRSAFANASKKVHSDIRRPFSVLADNEWDTWQDKDNGDVALGSIGKVGSGTGR